MIRRQQVLVSENLNVKERNYLENFWTSKLSGYDNVHSKKI